MDKTPEQEQATEELQNALEKYLTLMGLEAEFAIEPVWEFIEGVIWTREQAIEFEQNSCLHNYKDGICKTCGAVA